MHCKKDAHCGHLSFDEIHVSQHNMGFCNTAAMPAANNKHCSPLCMRCCRAVTDRVAAAAYLLWAVPPGVPHLHCLLPVQLLHRTWRKPQALLLLLL